MTYDLRFYAGDYTPRQRAANADRAICYIEQHFNWAPDDIRNWVEVIVARNASATSRAMGRFYCRQVAEAFAMERRHGDGLNVGGYVVNGVHRGEGNLHYTIMPAILLETCVATSREGSRLMKDAAAQHRMAVCLEATVRQFFPGGGLVAFSIGHKGKTSRPDDRGVAVLGGGFEADYAEIVLRKAARLLGGQAGGEGTVADPSLPDTPEPEEAVRFITSGRLSTFGGPGDDGVGPAEDLALVWSPAQMRGVREYFLDEPPPGTRGYARRLNPEMPYVACRWDYAVTPRRDLLAGMARVINPRTGRSAEAKPIDWGPHVATGRVADLSPGLARKLDLATDDLVQVIFS